jgi:hypothetical protein
VINRLKHPLTVSIIGSILSLFACGLALNATQEIKDSRRNSILLSCQEGNTHHKEAKQLIQGLLIKTEQGPHTKAAAKLQEEEISIFVEAIAPKHDCAKRVKTLTKS